MTRAWWLTAALAFAACPPVPTPEPEDAGEAVPPVFDGPTSPAGLPDVERTFDAGDERLDGGVIVLDGTCCDTRFSISDLEPTLVDSAKLRIALGGFASGVDLARDGGKWTATACFPVKQSATFFYEFTFDGGQVEVGSRELDDGGYETLFVGTTTLSQRASDDEPSFVDSAGQRFNLYPAVQSCAGLDGSVPAP